MTVQWPRTLKLRRVWISNVYKWQTIILSLLLLLDHRVYRYGHKEGLCVSFTTRPQSLSPVVVVQTLLLVVGASPGYRCDCEGRPGGPVRRKSKANNKIRINHLLKDPPIDMWYGRLSALCITPAQWLTVLLARILNSPVAPQNKLIVRGLCWRRMCWKTTTTVPVKVQTVFGAGTR